MSKKTIYLDYAAATPLDKRVFKAMQPYFSEQFYNPSAPYQPAREVRAAIEASRAQVARLLGAKPAEITFTAGATESINLAFHGLLAGGGHCVASNIEHAAVLSCAKKYDHTLAKVNTKGRLGPEALKLAVLDNTVLVSVGMVNNETGVIQDIKGIAGLLEEIKAERRKKGSRTPLYLHTDATQAAGCLDLSVDRLGIDLLTLGGNKIYGPIQTGILYASSKISLEPLIVGGGQELGLRSGTENTAGIIGFSEALRFATELRPSEVSRLQQLKQFFVSQLVDSVPETVTISGEKYAAPHIVALGWPGLDAERLLFRLEAEGVLVNTGAACAAKKDGYSHVLKALGLESSVIAGSLRVSFGRETNQNELERAVKIIAAAIKQER